MGETFTYQWDVSPQVIAEVRRCALYPFKPSGPETDAEMTENPMTVLGAAFHGDEPVGCIAVLDELAGDIEDRELQLSVLEILMVDRKMQRDIFLAGRPVRKGWMSSRYGHRVDPITGKRAMHYGVDFAGRYSADVIAVAAGVVVYADEKSGYGKMVEINHGGGYSTRYGHHKELVVKVGDIVRKGEVVGLMGSSGRSTGPHVHYEVFKNGRIVDPATYILRASR